MDVSQTSSLPGLPWITPETSPGASPTRPYLQQLLDWRSSRRCCEWTPRAQSISKEGYLQWRNNSLATQDIVKLRHHIQLWVQMCRALDQEGSCCDFCQIRRPKTYKLLITKSLVVYRSEESCEAELTMLKVAQVMLDYFEQCMRNFVGLYYDYDYYSDSM